MASYTEIVVQGRKYRIVSSYDRFTSTDFEDFYEATILRDDDRDIWPSYEGDFVGEIDRLKEEEIVAEAKKVILAHNNFFINPNELK